MDFDSLSTANWYPGHMRKAQREIGERLKLIDVVVELVDARAPLSCRNMELDAIIQQKARIVVLTKSDLADPQTTSSWVEHFRDSGATCIAVHHRQKNAIAKLLRLIPETEENHRNARGSTTPRFHAIRVMILGIPNVGKSSLINAIVRRKSAKTGPRPGITRHQQWVKVGADIELLDTPGVLQPRIKDAETGLRLGLVATIKDSIVGIELLCEYFLHVCEKQGRTEFLERLNLSEFPADVDVFLDQVGRTIGVLGKGEVVDKGEAGLYILREYRAGRLGRITLELP